MAIDRFALQRVLLSAGLALLVAACGNSAAPLDVQCPPRDAVQAIGPASKLAAQSAAVPPFETIYHDVVALPDDVQPWAPTWSPDGQHILFNNIADGNEWVANADGSDARCLTCNMADVAKITGAFSYIFPDNKRMFLANELGDFAYVLECAPSLFDCSSHEFLAVDFSADTSNPIKLSLGRRTFHLAPDGVHLAYSMVRLDALIMMVAELQKTADGYAVVNHRVVNPAGPASIADQSVEGWSNAGQLYEFKSFIDGGAKALVVGQPDDGNADTLILDLVTGLTTRLTSEVDWDEDGAISPDGSTFLVASWRTMHRLEAFGLMPLGRPFFDYPLGATVAIYYVSSFDGFQCDLQPWLLPADGDRGGTLTGQPVAPYAGGDIIAGNNLAALSFWSPDSTRILVQERRRTRPTADAGVSIQQKGYSPNRLLIARIDRDASPLPVAKPTVVGDWASTPAAYNGIYATPTAALIRGRAGGTINAVFAGNVAAGQFTAIYNGYSDDGINFLDGAVSSTGGATSLLNYVVNLTATDASGAETGVESGNIQFISKMPAPAAGQPPSTKSGNITATYRGKTASVLPDVGECPDSLPKPNPLILTATPSGNQLLVQVSASIAGDTRPVRRAVVTLGSQQVKTNDTGMASLALPSSKAFEVSAAAGDTFLPASIAVNVDEALPGCVAKAAESISGGGSFSWASLAVMLSAWWPRRRRSPVANAGVRG